MSNCSNAKYAGPELSHCCDGPLGTPVIKPAVYELIVINSELTSDCDLLQEDDGQMVLENDGQILCVDNV